MYQSQQYLNIGGKLITCPFKEDETLHGVSLYDLMCQLHESGAEHITDFQAIIMSAVEVQIGQSELDKATAVYKRIMLKLSELGVSPRITAH